MFERRIVQLPPGVNDPHLTKALWTKHNKKNKNNNKKSKKNKKKRFPEKNKQKHKKNKKNTQKSVLCVYVLPCALGPLGRTMEEWNNGTTRTLKTIKNL